MKCAECGAESPDGKNFCSACGSLLSPQLVPIVHAQVEAYIREHFKDRKLVDIETTEAIASRLQKWGKWFLIPATILVTILALTFALVGIRDVSDVHKAAQEAIGTATEATSKAQEAVKKAQDAEDKSNSAIHSIDAATTTIKTQLDEASRKVAGLESRTAEQVASANKHVESRVNALDKSVEDANKAINEQQAKLISTNELVTAMFSQGKDETFETDKGNSATFATTQLKYPLDKPQPKGAAEVVIDMLLEKAPIPQTVQLNFHVYVQPKTSYFVRANRVTFFWGESLDKLKQWALEVSYVPDPTYHGPIYKELTVLPNGITTAK